MAPRKSTGKPRGRPRKAAPRRMGMSRQIVSRAFNPSPIFTESYVERVNLSVNAGFLLTTKITNLAQVAQYSSLYTKYKILSAKFMLMPYFQAGSSDENAATYNNSQGQGAAADTRVVYAIQDSPNQAVPVSESAVLQDNGCRIRFLKNKVVIRCKPVPQREATDGVFESQKVGPFINFDVTAPGVTPAHYGVVGWISQPVSGAAHVIPNQVMVYVKLTFQLKDPR